MRQMQFLLGFVFFLSSPVFCQTTTAPLLELEAGHSFTIIRLCYSPDGTLLASVGNEGTAKLWDASTGKLLRTFWAPLSTGLDVCFSPDGQSLYVAFQAGIAGWDIKTGRRLPFPETVGDSCIAVSPDGSTACQYGLGVIALWRQGQKTELKDLQGREVNYVQFYAEGKYLIGCNGSGYVAIWGTDTRILIKKMRVAERSPFPYGMFKGLAISPNGKILACSGDGNVVNLWSLPEGQLLRTFKGFPTYVRSVTFDKTGIKLAAVAGGFARILDINSNDDEGLKIENTGLNSGLAFNHDESLLAFGSYTGQITLWSVAEKKVKQVLRGFSGSISALAVSPNDCWLVWDGIGGAMAWDLKQGVLKTMTSYGVGDSSFSSRDSSTVLIGSGVACIIKWDSAKAAFQKTELGSLIPNNHYGNTSAFSPDGSLLAVSGPLEIIDGKSFDTILLIDHEKRKIYRKLKGHEIETEVNTTLQFSPDGRFFASHSNSGTVHLWDISTGECKKEFKASAGVRRMIFTPDGQFLITQARLDGDIAFYSVRDGSLQSAFKVNTSWNRWLSISPDGHRLVSVDGGGNLIVWDVASGKILHTLTAYQNSGIGVTSWFADSRRFISGGPNGVATVWDSETGKSLASLMIVPPPPDAPEGTQPEWLIVTPEGYFNSSLNGAKIAKWRIGDQLYSLEDFAERFKRPDLVVKAIAGESLDAYPSLTTKRTPPRVTLAFLKAGASESEAAKIQVTIVPGSPEAVIKRVELNVNGRLIDLDRARGISVALKGITIASKSVEFLGKAQTVQRLSGDTKTPSMIVQATIPLGLDEPGAHIRVTAFDDFELKGESGMIYARRKVPLTSTSTLPVTSNLYLLAVGVSKYENKDYNLNYSDADAIELAEVFKAQEGKAFNKVNTRLITNEQATAGNLKEALQWLKETPGRSDIAVLLFSGHGVRGSGGKLYFFTHNGDLDALRDSCLGWNEVDTSLEACKARQVLMFMDCCHAGAFGERRASSEDLAERLVRKAGVLVFASCRGYEQSYENSEWKHGAFTKGVIDGLRGAADPYKLGAISVTGLLDYLAVTIPRMTQDKQHPWVPRADQFDTQLRLTKLN